MTRRDLPPPLLVAASLVAVQGLLVVAYAVLEAFATSADRAVMGATTSVFFLAYGVLLVACGWWLSRGRSWARGPVLLSQLMWLGLAWSFRGGSTTVVAVVLAVVAVVTLAGMLHPDSIEALNQEG